MLLRLKSVRRWHCEFDRPALIACRSYSALIDELFGAWLRKEGKPRWGDKTPKNVLQMRTLAQIFPSARFIHVYRDGRDAAYSWIASPHGPENRFAAAAEWQTLVQTGRRIGATLAPGSYTELRYETLLEQPEATMRRICDFIGEPFDAAVLQQNVLPIEVRVQRIPGFRGSARGLNGQPAIARNNVAKWKTNVTLEQRSLFESVAGGTLRELGYETEDHLRRPPPGGLSRLGWRLHSAAFETLVKLNTQTIEDWATTIFEMHKARLRARLKLSGHN